MNVRNRTGVKTPELDRLMAEVGRHESLGDVLGWGLNQEARTTIPTVISDIVVQDEYTHDVVVPWGDEMAVVYGTT